MKRLLVIRIAILIGTIVMLFLTGAIKMNRSPVAVSPPEVTQGEEADGQEVTVRMSRASGVRISTIPFVVILLCAYFLWRYIH